MSKLIYPLITGLNYAFTCHLGPIDQFASPDEIKQRFESVGFIEVMSLGEGRHRTIKGKWAGKTGDHEFQEQITNIEVL